MSANSCAAPCAFNMCWMRILGQSQIEQFLGDVCLTMGQVHLLSSGGLPVPPACCTALE